jgi:polysaccharide transporter, PST family
VGPFDQNGMFRPLNGELRHLSVRGAGASLMSGGVGLFLQVGSTAVLARILTPSDFGLVAMVTIFSLLLVNFGLNGFTEAIVQRRELNQALSSNLFWINCAAGLSLTLLFAASGALLARFYHDERAARVAVAISLTILLTSLSVIHLALLKRAMHFSAVALNDIRARAISVVVSIVMGLTGFGYWALVGGAVALPLSQAAGAWFLCRWWPSLPRRVAGTGSMCKFALHTYGFFSLNYLSRNIDNALVGWRFNAQALGFYKKAYDLFALSSTQVSMNLTLVVVSALSRLRQNAVQYRRYLLRALAVLAFVGMGASGALTLIGRDLIRVLLGPGWEASGQIFTLFAPGIGIMLIYVTHGWIHLSIGRADRWMRWGVVELLVTVSLFAGALHWGPDGIAVAWTLSYAVLLLPAFWYAGRPIGFGITDMLGAIWKYLVSSVLACLLSEVVIRECFPPVLLRAAGYGPLERIVAMSILFLLAYVIAVVWLHGGLDPIRQFVELLKEMASMKDRGKPVEISSGNTEPLTGAESGSYVVADSPEATGTAAKKFIAAGR